MHKEYRERARPCARLMLRYSVRTRHGEKYRACADLAPTLGRDLHPVQSTKVKLFPPGVRPDYTLVPSRADSSDQDCRDCARRGAPQAPPKRSGAIAAQEHGMSFWGFAARPDFAATVDGDHEVAVLSLIGTCAVARAGPQFHFPEAAFAFDEALLVEQLPERAEVLVAALARVNGFRPRDPAFLAET